MDEIKKWGDVHGIGEQKGKFKKRRYFLGKG